MNGLSLRWKMIIPVISSIVIGIVITVILVGYTSRTVVISEIEKSTLLKLKDTVFISITTMMTSGSMSESKEMMLAQMKDTASLRLIRAHAMDADYGKGKDEEYPQNSTEQQVIDSGEAVITRTANIVHGVFPYTAGSNIMGINCLDCHNVPENTVLGALEVQIPLVDSLDRIKHYQLLFAAFGLIGTVALTIFIYLLSKAIFNPLEKLTTNVAKVSDGDLTIDFAHKSKDEIGVLSSSMNDMVRSFRELIGKISSSSTDIVAVVEHLSTEARTMAAGSEDQASQIMQIATANEEMAATSGDIANNCHLAEESAREAENMAHDGAVVVKNTIRVMSTIADRVKVSADTVSNLGSRSDQIGAIVGTIEDIADQTNLLALNAAIEAARAGEMGRGFAVVADEVRALAERTTRATREISDMIKAIQDDTCQAVQSMEAGVAEVENGTREATSSGEALERILDKIAVVTMQVSQIATAAGQQTDTIHEINTSIQMVSDVAQRNGDVGKEVLSEVNQLTETSQELQVATSRFRFH